MASPVANKALTLEERRIIENGIRSGATKTAIAQTIGKEKSTVGKEIKLHRRQSYKCRMPLECSEYRRCKFGRECKKNCPDYVPFKCTRRDRSPGACNGCSSLSKCRFDKYIYSAADANQEYRTTLVDSRTGVNLTTTEAKDMAAIIKPLLEQGLSPYQIIATHPELDISEKTLYNYIDWQVFDVVGIKNIDLRRKTGRKLPKKKAKEYKKREDRAFLKGRLYTDYQYYLEQHPSAHILQMDTVYNDVSNGPFVQTFKFLSLGLMIGIYHDSKTADDMLQGINILDDALGHSLFEKYCGIILTDRGSEFSRADEIEHRADGTRRTRLFFCDPMQSCQKGSLEVNHELLRYILPKNTNLRALGLISQEALNLAVSHIASAPLESLEGKSPAEYVRFMAPKLWKKLLLFGLKEIPKDEIVLKHYLLKPFVKHGKT